MQDLKPEATPQKQNKQTNPKQNLRHELFRGKNVVNMKRFKEKLYF